MSKTDPRSVGVSAGLKQRSRPVKQSPVPLQAPTPEELAALRTREQAYSNGLWLTQTLGRNIAAGRERILRLGKSEFADMLGISRMTLRRMEQGDGGVAIETYAAALAALRVHMRVGIASSPFRKDDGFGIAPSKARAAPKAPVQAASEDGGQDAVPAETVAGVSSAVAAKPTAEDYVLRLLNGGSLAD